MTEVPPCVSLPSKSQPLTIRNFSPASSGSFRVETTVPTTTPINMAGLLTALRFFLAAERQDEVDVGVRARDDVHRHQLADALGCALAGLGGRLHRRDVATNDRG